MPEIIPILPKESITIQANTQLPSAKMRTETNPSTETIPPQTPTTTAPATEPAKDERLIKARLVQEKMKRQIENERRQLAEEKRQIEMQRAQSRKWLEAEELVQQGKYIEAAQRAGLSYDQLTQQILNNGQIPPAQIAEKTANELVERKLQEYQKQQENQARAAQQKQYNEALRHIASEVKYIVDSSDKYPLVKNAEAYHDIVKSIETEFHRTGRIVPVEEAVERWENEALQGLEELVKLDKVRSNVFKDSQRPPTQDKVPSTLSQRTMAPVPAPKGLSEQERRQRAIDAFYGRLT